MEKILILTAVVNVMMLTAFFMGYKIGEKKEAGEEKSKNKMISQREKERQEEMQVLLSNIDNYDGTASGQREVRGV